MDGLLKLSKEDALQIDDLTYHGDLSIKRVTRHMLRVLSREVTWKGRENSQSLRGVWYGGIKQVYQNLFPEKWESGHYSAPPGRRFSQALSEHLSEMVKEGELTYRDLNVVDDSRDREIVGTSNVEHDKILFVEKRAKYRQLKPISDVLGVSLVSGGGWQATALIEDLANVLDPDESYDIFVLTDYDPTGYRIAEDFRSRARTLGVNIDTVERVGIEPDQVDSDVQKAERFEVPVDNDYDRQWLRDHGIENEHGDPVYGLELEAIGERNSAASDFRRVVVEALEPRLRKRRRREKDLNIETANTVGRGVDDLVDEITEDLTAALKEYAIDVLEAHEAVNSLRYEPSEDKVFASVDLDERVDSADGRIPHPLPWRTYRDEAIDPSNMNGDTAEAPRPDRSGQVEQLHERLRDEMADEDGDIDVDALLGLE
jgi:5S rRNA maturation endonuclease (ribonuclease M5)